MQNKWKVRRFSWNNALISLACAKETPLTAVMLRLHMNPSVLASTFGTVIAYLSMSKAMSELSKMHYRRAAPASAYQ